MGIVILTTETTHHAYFVRELSRHARIDWVLLETESKLPPFETSHPYENQRDEYEREKWFDRQSRAVGEFAEAWRVVSANGESVPRRLRETRPDAVFVFGTGMLQPATISACGDVVLNLHGGNPLAYRGLDSHLWAIYHRDFDALSAALHRVNAELDCGDIVEMAPLSIERDMQLHELRSVNTEACVSLCRRALEVIAGKQELRATSQASKGRYYSHMPSVLKSLCVDRFANYTRNLP